MKRDHDQPRARAQSAGRRLDEPIEPFELAVDPDPQRLKRARRRIDAHEAAARNGAPHDRGQLSGRVDRRPPPRVDDGARDAARKPLFAVLKNRVGELAFTRPGHQIGGGVAAAPVHPHVERLVALEAESAARRVELHRRHAEIGERAVDDGNAEAIEHGVEGTEVGVHEIDPFAPRRQRLARAVERVEIAVESDDPGGAGRQQRAGVPAEAHRTIDEDAAALGLQVLNPFSSEDRDVRDQIPNSDSARASSSVYGSRCILVRKRSWFQTSR